MLALSFLGPSVNISAKTAIARTRLSAPTAYLHRHGKLVGRVLDYGCGRGFDCDTLGYQGYDPNHRPKTPPVGKYDTIVCNYVLNVIENKQEREDVLRTIYTYLAKGGTAYISVRADTRALNRRTKLGTWQGDIHLSLPVVSRTSSYRMYSLFCPIDSPVGEVKHEVEKS